MDWMDEWKSPGGVKYRAAYAANNHSISGINPAQSWPELLHRPSFLSFFVIIFSMTGTLKIMMRPILTSCDLSGLYKFSDTFLFLGVAWLGDPCLNLSYWSRKSQENKKLKRGGQGRFKFVLKIHPFFVTWPPPFMTTAVHCDGSGQCIKLNLSTTPTSSDHFDPPQLPINRFSIRTFFRFFGTRFCLKVKRGSPLSPLHVVHLRPSETTSIYGLSDQQEQRYVFLPLNVKFLLLPFDPF